jgi:hypothetical protein
MEISTTSIQDIETKLLQLKSLVDKQLITEDDFKAAKSQALQQFIQPTFSTHQPLANSTPTRTTTSLSATQVPLPSQVPLVSPVSLPSPIHLNPITPSKQEDVINTDTNIKQFLETKVADSSFTMDDSISETETQIDNTMIAKVDEMINENETVTTAHNVDISHIVKSNFSQEKLKDIDNLSVDEFWSILLQLEIPEGDFYPPPDDMVEPIREPFAIECSFFASLIDNDKTSGLKRGASVALRAFHLPLYHKKLSIPWTLERTVLSQSDIYTKSEVAKLIWHCPYQGCNVVKLWFIVNPQVIKVCKTPLRTNKAKSLVKRLMLNSIATNNTFSFNEYAVIEIIADQRAHTY